MRSERTMAAGKAARRALTAGICTSGSRVKTALLAGGVFRGASKKCLNQENVLFRMLDRLLGPHKAGLRDLTALCVVTGPGRFTGLRVGLTLASALKTLAGIEVRSATLFEILAEQAAASKEFRTWASGVREPRLAALVHAFKDEYFCQVFRPRIPRGGGASAVPVEPPLWLKAAELSSYLGKFGSRLYSVADAEEDPGIYSLVPPGSHAAPARISRVLPEFVIRTAFALKKRDLSPLYLKPAKYEM